jgi:hypothetical protein
MLHVIAQCSQCYLLQIRNAYTNSVAMLEGKISIGISSCSRKGEFKIYFGDIVCKRERTLAGFFWLRT